MKNTFGKRILTLLLAAMMVMLAGCGRRPLYPTGAGPGWFAGTSAAEETTEQASEAQTEAPETTAAEETATQEQAPMPVYIYPVRTPVDFSEMTCDNFDAAVMDAAIEDLMAKLTASNAFGAICADFDIIVDQFDAVNTDDAIANIRYSADTTDDAVYDLYCEKEEQYDLYYDKMCVAFHAALQSQYGDQFAVYIGSDQAVEYLAGYTAMTDREFELSKEYNDLVDRYFDMMDKDDTPQHASPADFGELYLEILDNLIESNEEDGVYDTFTEYAYTAYNRDYSPEETEKFHEWVKTFVAPYMVRFSDSMFDLVGPYYRYYYQNVTEADVISRVKPYIISVSGLHAEAFDMLEKYHLYDFSMSDTKMNAGYTTKLNTYGVPFIFNQPTGGAADIETMIHEFGHFTEMYNNKAPEFYNFDCFDVAEIDSQGLEMLMMHYAEEIYGEGCGTISRYDNVLHLLSVIVDGCIFDEFQQEAIKRRMEGTLTTGQQVSELFNEVANRYGTNMWGYGWYVVHHTFDAPFYYISYATSAAAALGFLVLEQENGYDSAVAAYNEMVEMGCGEGYGYTLEAVGLPDPFTEDGAARLSEGLSLYFEALLAEAAEVAAEDAENGGGRYAIEDEE